MKSQIIPILMCRDGMTLDEARELLEECKQMVREDGLDPEQVLYDELGLEPDFIWELLP